MSHDFNTDIVDVVSHRPWPMPDRPWVMTQTWHDLLFAHWPIDPHEMRPKVPPEFELDLFGGMAWIGIVPFYMTNVAPRGIPSLPWVSEFPELNVRTYVHRGGRDPGVWFFSLDATSLLAVAEVGRTVGRVDPDGWPAVAETFAHVNVLDLDRRIIEHAARLGPATLRTLDAIHLATALQLGPELRSFVTYDRRLAAAARDAGLPVASPGADLDV